MQADSAQASRPARRDLLRRTEIEVVELREGVILAGAEDERVPLHKQPKQPWYAHGGGGRGVKGQRRRACMCLRVRGGGEGGGGRGQGGGRGGGGRLGGVRRG